MEMINHAREREAHEIRQLRKRVVSLLVNKTELIQVGDLWFYPHLAQQGASGPRKAQPVADMSAGVI